MDKQIEIDKPEILLYEKRPDGSYRLNGVEYIIPYRAWPKDSVPPKLMGRDMLKSDELLLWYTHMWIWTPNSAGCSPTGIRMSGVFRWTRIRQNILTQRPQSTRRGFRAVQTVAANVSEKSNSSKATTTTTTTTERPDYKAHSGASRFRESSA
jgi:hypothetical protein